MTRAAWAAAAAVSAGSCAWTGSAIDDGCPVRAAPLAALVAASPLTGSDLSAAYAPGSDVLDAALREQGLKIDAEGVPVDAGCTMAADGREVLALRAPAWTATAVVEPDGALRPVVTAATGSAPVPAPAPLLAQPPIVGNATPEGAALSADPEASATPPAPDPAYRVPSPSAGSRELAASGSAVSSDGADAAGAQVSDAPPRALPTPLPAPAPAPAPVDPACAALAPPSLRVAVAGALACAGSEWRLLPPGRGEPRDYRLHRRVVLRGSPADWIAALGTAYGLRFER